MFLQVSVILLTGGSASVHPGIHPPAKDTPLPRRPVCQGDPPPRRPPHQGRQAPPARPTPKGDYCCGRYASYWNAFLFVDILIKVIGWFGWLNRHPVLEDN